MQQLSLQFQEHLYRQDFSKYPMCVLFLWFSPTFEFYFKTLITSAVVNIKDGRASDCLQTSCTNSPCVNTRYFPCVEKNEHFQQAWKESTRDPVKCECFCSFSSSICYWIDEGLVYANTQEFLVFGVQVKSTKGFHFRLILKDANINNSGPDASWRYSEVC